MTKLKLGVNFVEFRGASDTFYNFGPNRSQFGRKYVVVVRKIIKIYISTSKNIAILYCTRVRQYRFQSIRAQGYSKFKSSFHLITHHSSYSYFNKTLECIANFNLLFNQPSRRYNTLTVRGIECLTIGGCCRACPFNIPAARTNTVRRPPKKKL